MRIINGGKRRSEYNYLFGMIMSQWFSRQENVVCIQVDEDDKESTTTERLLTNERLEAIIFDQPLLNLDKWHNFLQNEVFSCFDGDETLKTVFEKFKLTTTNYGFSLLKEKVSFEDVKRAIQSLMNNGLLDEPRKRLIGNMLLDANAVQEFASSLTLMISDLSEWNWSIEGIHGVFRRNLAGRYRCFYEEDFLTAIFLQHLGLKWSYHFKSQLKLLFESLTNTALTNCLPKSLQHERLQLQRNDFWMASLPNEIDDTVPYDYTVSYTDTRANVVSLKEKVLYVTNVEIQLHQVLYPDLPFTVACADLEWFGPSISHECLQPFLELCGVPKVWLEFFDRFLKQPVYYKSTESSRQRRRGVPISHSLSYLFAELFLFGMDLYVYRKTGVFNYRLHDDFWFFDPQVSKVEQAWKLMNEYTQMCGLKFNDAKCGSIQIRPANTTDHTDESHVNVVMLPNKDVKWDLLILESTGRFVVNQQAIVPFLDEMKVRLTNASTIVEWVNLYNKYMTFFMRNLGTCANVLGIHHIEQKIKAFQFIHEYLFTETNSNALTVLTNRIVQQFPNSLTDEISEAWFYWPLTSGGLGLKNVYLDLHSVHKRFLCGNVTTFQQLLDKDVKVYAKLLEEYSRQKTERKNLYRCDISYKFLETFVEVNDRFVTFNEFIAQRETHLEYWGETYATLLKITEAQLPEQTTSSRYMTVSPPNQLYRSEIKQADSYWQWLRCYYDEQIESVFGQLDFVDSESLPIGLIEIMKTTDIDWDK
ncbi:unnamed protein product [Rotaria sp. Silwood2]|nr:unnamed protein product [Rotaria sp. Silwood2]CAF3286752.1 unnamed protein product [Rotaria sp. Silwood2]CAF3406423.1 unnamed protein product [Rotaria sp. Silwood2]CAF4284025.1 unnamed protein product [Rotaria sp. Silwood2]CAF4448430.1 unnamed protein product [Rotaria sp. Silwood2]